MRFVTFILGFLFLASSVFSADSVQQPMLWKIEGATPHYLFGTIHLPDPRVTTLHPSVNAAFAESKIVATELELSASNILAMANASMLSDGKTLTEILPSNTKKNVNAELKRVSPQLSLAMFDRLKIWALAANLPLLPIQLKHRGQLSLDIMLAQNAVRDGKQTVGLELIEEQLGIFDALSEQEQILLLNETIRSLVEARGKGVDAIEVMIQAYLSGDGKQIKALTEEGLKGAPELGERLMKQLLDDRNIVMAERIAKRVNTPGARPHFIAVGAAHLVGDRSVIAHLEQAGFKITRVQ